MFRYHLIASLDKNLRALEFFEDLESSTMRVVLPLLTSTGEFRYSLQATVGALSKLHIYPSESGFDVIIIGLMVYIADMKISRRKQSQDSWSREITLEIPVFDERWTQYQYTLERMLKFLTGDFWSLEFTKREIEFAARDKESERTDEYGLASLFSGGMDSLIGAINLMEQKQPTLFVSHAGEGRVRSWQTNLLSIIDENYKDVPHTNAYLWTSLTDIELPHADKDMNQRSRSFLFIAIAIFAMTGTKKCLELHMPENGLIALNVPLDSTRIGSHSTRTTHPFYLGLWNEIARGIFGISITNTYWNKTKGEMAVECLNKDILKMAIGKSYSCSSVNSVQIRSGLSQHCGHCLPCIIRRAAIHHAFGKWDVSEYFHSKISKIRSNRDLIGEQLRSLEYAISRIKKNPMAKRVFIHKPGPLYSDETYLAELSDMYYRGLMEIDRWLHDSLENEHAD